MQKFRPALWVRGVGVLVTIATLLLAIQMFYVDQLILGIVSGLAFLYFALVLRDIFTYQILVDEATICEFKHGKQIVKFNVADIVSYHVVTPGVKRHRTAGTDFFLHLNRQIPAEASFHFRSILEQAPVSVNGQYQGIWSPVFHIDKEKFIVLLKSLNPNLAERHSK